jgi:LysM repeat protein
MSLFTTPTSTATNTATVTPVTPTATATATSTLTATPTVTVTNTPAGPVEYVVKEGDNCYAIAADNKVDFDVFMELNGFGNSCSIKPGQKVLIPLQGAELPTETPLPANFPAGQKIEYTVKSGELLSQIAARFNSSEEAIIAIKENNLTSAGDLKARQKLIVPVNIVTQTPTKAPTVTKSPAPAATNTSAPAATNTPAAATATATAKP